MAGCDGSAAAAGRQLYFSAFLDLASDGGSAHLKVAAAASVQGYSLLGVAFWSTASQATHLRRLLDACDEFDGFLLRFSIGVCLEFSDDDEFFASQELEAMYRNAIPRHLSLPPAPFFLAFGFACGFSMYAGLLLLDGVEEVFVVFAAEQQFSYVAGGLSHVEDGEPSASRVSP